MKAKIRLTKSDVVISLVCVVFGLTSLGAIGRGGRERAKRAVCMGNLRALTAAWSMYSDDNEGILVNGSASFSKNANGTSHGHVWDDWIDSRGIIFAQITGETEIAEAYVKANGTKTKIGNIWYEGTNLLYRYCGDIKFFKCPSAEPGEVLNYSIVSAMAGSATWWWPDYTGCMGPPFYRRSEILRPSKRFVFVDEGRITVDSWDVCFSQPRWHDMPPGQHNLGGTFSFADGHAEYHKWKTEDVIKLCGLSWWEASIYWESIDWMCNEDLMWVQEHAWGEPGYDTSECD